MGKLKIPHWLTIGLGAVLGVVGALNVATFGLKSPWTELVTFLCAGAASLGVSPLVHGALRNALHLTFPAALSIAGGMTTLCTAVTATHWDSTIKGIVVGVLTAAAGVLAGPDALQAPPSPTPPVAPVKTSP